MANSPPSDPAAAAPAAADTPLWRPDAARIAAARLTDYRGWLARERNLPTADYEALWQWSVASPDAFWRSIWDYFHVAGDPGQAPAITDARMPGARWFPDASLNYVEQVFSNRTTIRPAIIAGNESGSLIEVSWNELERRVGSLAGVLREHGVGRGDRVAAFLPNAPDAIVAFLACASLGAIWSLCSPDMGAASVLDRFRQITPKVLIATDGYAYGGKVHDRRETLASLRTALHSLEVFVHVPYEGLPAVVSASSGVASPKLSPESTSRPACAELVWQELVAGITPLRPVRVPFMHPLWIVYSSGTTGLPKPIVHGHGGVVLEHLKLNCLHNDLGPADRFHWYSSTGWIMWNCQVGGLLAGSTICIYDGNPGWPDLHVLWRFADAAGVTLFGAGAAFYASCMKGNVAPREGGRLPALRTLGSTGSPLSVEAYRWLQQTCGEQVWIAPMSGGTDIAGAFVAGNSTLPVFAGEMQSRCLGANVQAWDTDGRPVVCAVGELVCTTPMPSMPIGFWNDDQDKRYRDSYFDMWPGVWRHGDWIELTKRGGAVIYGRSDATINRFGIRMGTSELYAAIEALPEIVDSLVVDLEYLGRPSYMPLFVVLAAGAQFDETLARRVNATVRAALSPRHVPSAIFVVPAVPRTISGKKLEVPIKRLLLGEPLHKVANLDAVANPESLDWYVTFAQTLPQRLQAHQQSPSG